MFFRHGVLQLAPFWDEGRDTVLASSFVAWQLRREEGCEDLPVDEALRRFERLKRQPLSSWKIRQFVADAGFRADLMEMNDGQVADFVRVAIETRRVCGLRKIDKVGKRVDATTEQRRLVRNIEKQTHGHLNFSGRQYKLVVDVDLGQVPGRNSYEVAGRDEALRVLDGLAKEAGTSGDLSALLVQASAKLTPDWRPPRQPDGLILLRRIRQSSAPVKDTGPAITPSQLLKLRPSTWITIVVEDQVGAPWQGTLRLRLANGSQREDAVDDHGTVHLDGIEPGEVQIQRVLPPPTTHEVTQGESLPSIAAHYGWHDWKPIYDHVDNADLKRKRSNPNILFPGDKVVIPPPENDWLSRATGQSHTIVIHRPLVRFSMRLLDGDGKPLASIKYCLAFDSYKREGQTQADGFVDEPIPIAVRVGQLTLWPDSPSGLPCLIPINLGYLDPLSETSGVQARLANLGFFAGEIDGAETEDLAAALESFQETNGLDVTRQADAATLAKLREKHDGE